MQAVEQGQRWVSMRNGKAVRVLEVRTYEDGGRCARVETRPGWGRWVTCGAKGILGYRLLAEAE